MKKFILMLALSLGGIVSAQTFDFSCEIVDNGGNGFVESSALTLDEGFASTQITDIEDAGYIQDAAGETLTQTYTGVTVSIPNDNPLYGPSIILNSSPIVSVQTGTFYDDRGVAGADRGPFAYRILINGPDGGGYSMAFFFNHAEDAVAFLVAYNQPMSNNG